MGKIVAIGFGSLDKLNTGIASWSGDYFSQIFKYSNFKDISAKDISEGYAYISGKANNEMRAYEIDVEDVIVNKNRLELRYTVGQISKFTGGVVCSTIWDLLRFQFGSLTNIPFCIALEESDFKGIIEDDNLFKKIKELKKKNNWLEIANLFEPFEKISGNAVVWNNKSLVDNASFATAKLSEVYQKLKKVCNSDEEIKKYLETKKRYRNFTIKLRERCIELDDKSAGAYSNLGYTYYQSCMELTTPGGRRDGNLQEAANNAVKYLIWHLKLTLTEFRIVTERGKYLHQYYLLQNCIREGKNLKRAM